MLRSWTTLAFAVSLGLPGVASAQFVDVTSGPLGGTADSRGVAWGDYDNDGDLDLYIANSGSVIGPNKLLRNDGGGVFADVTSGPLGDGADGTGTAWGDYDNDGDLDLYLANSGYSRLLRNDGSEGFADVSSGTPENFASAQGVAWGDYDNDGDLDLYLANYNSANRLFRNDGDGVFVDATSGPLGDAGYGTGVAWGDYDDDGDLDLYLVNGTIADEATPNKLFRNDGGGVFVDVTNGPLGDPGSGRGVAWGDYDNDGDLDLYLANDGSPNRLMRNDGGDHFVDVTSGPLGDPNRGHGVGWGDYDNDGDLDLYLANNESANRLFRNDGGGNFVDVTSGPLGDEGRGQGVAWGDYDNDGDLDIYLSNRSRGNKLFRNEAAEGQHWLQVGLKGTVSNRAGIGARVTMVAGGVRQIREISGGAGYLSQDAMVASFGLGSATTVDSLIVRWPSGIVQVVVPTPAVDGALTIVEADTPLPIGFTFEPHNLNLNANGSWVTGYLEAPTEFTASEIEANSIRLNGTVAISAGYSPKVEDQGRTLKVKFPRSEVNRTLTPGEHVPVWVTGMIAGMQIAGTDFIRVQAPKMLSPKAGDLLTAGTTAHVAWEVPESPPGQSVTLMLSLDDGLNWTVETAGLANSGAYDWRVSGTTTDRARLAIVVPYGVDETGVIPESEIAASDAFSILSSVDVDEGEAILALRPRNPMMGSLSIRFSLASREPATLAVYDVSGRLMYRLEVGRLGPGAHMARLGNPPPGVYVVRLRQASRSLTTRVAVTR